MADPRAKKPAPSVLRRVYDAADQAVASRAEPLAQTGGFASALGVYMSWNRRIGRVVGGATGKVLHLVNIPTAADIKKLHQHLVSVDDHIAALIGDLKESSELEEAIAAARPPAAEDQSDADEAEATEPPAKAPASGRARGASSSRKAT